MTSLREFARRAAANGVGAISRLVGRRRAVRAVRFASNALTYDDSNRIAVNGETLVQFAARSRPDPVIFDVGANCGQWSTALLAQPGHIPVLHAFEPSSYSHARATDALGDHAQVHALALAAEPGEAELQIVREGAGVNSLVPFHGERATSTTEKVQVDTVDRFCDAHGIAAITLLKVDAEGLDFQVMLGASEMLKRGEIGIVQFEYNWRWVFSRTYLRDVFELIADLPSYSLGKVTPRGIEFYDRWHHELESFREANYVLAREDWRTGLPTIEWWGR